MSNQPTLSRWKRSLQKSVLTAGAALSISGCLFTSPYHGQVIKNALTTVPVQAWTTVPDKLVKVECAPSTHAGIIDPYPPWTQVANIRSGTEGMLDPLGNTIYSAAKKVQVPQICWNPSATTDKYYTAIRVYSGSDIFYSFTASGLECLGSMIGDKTTWFGWNETCVSKTAKGDPGGYVVISTE